MWFIEMFSVASFISGIIVGYMWSEHKVNKKKQDEAFREIESRIRKGEEL